MAKTPPSVWRNPIHFVAFGFGSGAAPKAPGTAGTALAVLLYFPLSRLPDIGYGLLLVVGFGFGIWICGKTSRDLGEHDHGGIVWDEFVGYWLTMFMAPAGWWWALVGFALFRLFDILKPWPVGYLDRTVGGGLGIMLDDVLAGIMAALCLQASYFLMVGASLIE